MNKKKILLSLFALAIIGTSAGSELFADGFYVSCSAGRCCYVNGGVAHSGKLDAIVVIP
jgi:hypothetical protein